MILIGSRALSLRVGKLLPRKPLDFDFVATEDEARTWVNQNAEKIGMTKTYMQGEDKLIAEGRTNVEFDLVRPGNSNELLVELVEKDGETIETSMGMLPSLNILFAIKNSHRFKKFSYDSRPFYKHAIDWHLMKRLGATINPEHEEFRKLREKESYAGEKHPKLNVSKDAFFQDDVPYVYEHDDIHRSVMLYSCPAYELYLQDGEEVKCSKSKFFAVSEEVRMAGALEEGLVLSIERSLVSFPGVWTPDYAFRFAYGKVCTSITSGWFRQYCFEHLFDVLKLYESRCKGYWEKFQSDVAAGKVRPFSGKRY